MTFFKFLRGGVAKSDDTFFECDRLCVKTSLMTLCVREKQRECVYEGGGREGGFIVLSMAKNVF